ncbi:hypothetical protein VTN00DRAFT_1698 [Thermoascus crustaceus]|uniref:uncharacterized protein n=1 Tax=Thermoascus crustaceus TaxID=5088 RepID=UPI003741F068
MSTVARPKKSRRRQRTRKKRGPVTIESIIPGRVPVGFLPTDLEAAPYLAVDSSLTGRSSERSGVSPALVSSHSQLSIHTPVPDKLKTSFSSSFLGIPSAPVLLGPGQYSSRLGQRSVSATAPSNPKPLLPNRASSGGPPDNYSVRNPSSPELSQEGRLEMAGFGPSWSSQARAAELNAAAAARARSATRELDDFNSLPSSQPIPLSALSSRAYTRNKGSKSWKPFLPDDAKESSGNVNLLREKTDLSSGTYAAISYKPDTTKIDNQTNNPLRGAIRVNTGFNELQEQSKENAMNPGQHFWVHGLEPRLQENPLGQYGGFNVPFDDTTSQYYYYTPAIPYLSGMSHLQGSGHMMPMVISPARQEEKFVARRMQETTFCQSLPCEDPFMAESSFHAYGPELYAAANQSQLRPQDGRGSSLYTHQRQGQMDLRSRPPAGPDSFSEAEDERYIDYAPTRPPGAFHDARPGLPVETTNPVISVTAPQTQTPTSLSARSSVSAAPSVAIKAKLSDSRERHSARKLEPYDAKKEMTAFLNSVVEASKSTVARTVLHDPLKTPTSKDQLKKERQPAETLSLPERSDRTTNEDNKSLPLARARVPSGVSKTVSFLEPSDTAAAESKQTAEQTVPQRESIDKPEEDLAEVTLLEIKLVDDKVVKFPPPGLPPPGLEMPRVRSLERSALENSRVAESNCWFHTDGRGEEELRQHVTEIARADTERRQKLRGATYPLREDQLAEQTTLLLGNVIANLQSYVVGDRKEQAGNFANFGMVPYHCCEPSHGGRISYFDRDPLIHQWRLPPGRAFTSFSLRASSGRPLEGRFLTAPIFHP